MRRQAARRRGSDGASAILRSPMAAVPISPMRNSFARPRSRPGSGRRRRTSCPGDGMSCARGRSAGRAWQDRAGGAAWCCNQLFTRHGAQGRGADRGGVRRGRDGGAHQFLQTTPGSLWRRARPTWYGTRAHIVCCRVTGRARCGGGRHAGLLAQPYRPCACVRRAAGFPGTSLEPLVGASSPTPDGQRRSPVGDASRAVTPALRLRLTEMGSSPKGHGCAFANRSSFPL